jgi:hypothetical protein
MKTSLNSKMKSMSLTKRLMMRLRNSLKSFLLDCKPPKEALIAFQGRLTMLFVFSL